MMKLLVLSDTHGNYPLAIRAIEQAGHVDQIVHLGDDMEDAFIIERVIGQPIVKVPGNCDFAAKVPRELCKSIAQKKVLLTHGDKYSVKSGLGQLYKKALAEKVHIVLYGHSHQAAIETIEEILFVNPGCLNRSSATPTYAIINIVSGEVSAGICLVTDT